MELLRLGQNFGPQAIRGGYIKHKNYLISFLIKHNSVEGKLDLEISYVNL